MDEAREHHVLFEKRLWSFYLLMACAVASLVVLFFRVRTEKRRGKGRGEECSPCSGLLPSASSDMGSSGLSRSSLEMEGYCPLRDAVLRNALQRLEPSPKVSRRPKRLKSLLRRMKKAVKALLQRKSKKGMKVSDYLLKDPREAVCILAARQWCRP